MNRWIRTLASLKLNAGLLLLLALVLGAGTIVESTRGAEAARLVYGAPWFKGLLALLGINLLCSIWALRPWGRHRIGYLLTHGSMLLILVGAGISDGWKVEGQLALWEGERADHFTGRGPGPPRALALPFAVRLDSFEIDHYPGTRRPAMFRSRVRVIDPGAGEGFPAVIEMNRELAHRGYRLFQSSYQLAGGRRRTVLAVSRDPGQGVVFLGYALLVAGMLTVLGTRIAQRRALSTPPTREGSRRDEPAQPAPGARAVLGALAVFSLLGGGGIAEAAADLPDPAVVERLRALPVQHDGRTMPLDTLAREAVWRVTGERRYQGHDPVALVLGWSLRPDLWAAEAVIPVGSAGLAAEAGLTPGARRSSFVELASRARLLELMRRARSESEAERPLTPLLREAQELEQRLVWMQGFLRRESIRPLPAPQDPRAGWSAVAPLQSAAQLVGWLERLREAPPPGYPSPEEMRRELRYNRLRPARLAWWILFPAALLSLLSWLRPRRWSDLLAVLGLLAGFAVMSWGIAVRWRIAGHIPATNMYESLLFLGWGVGCFALVASLALRQRLLIFNATSMAALTMLLVDLLPLDPFLHPVPPVLAGTPWLAIHVPIIMVSYSVLALGVLAAHMQIGATILLPARRELIERVSDLLYWYVHIGSILLLVGILTGSVWAASSWGRYWGWDPKEVWSLIAFLAYMAILHLRIERLVGPFGVAALSILAFWTVVMTYVGVNYVLAAGLHSYGFGGSEVLRWMLVLLAVEAFFLSIGLVAHLRARGSAAGLPLAP